ncbi:MAG: DNA topoisomerase 3 [Muribaculaceae bacterium]|nr:DNA topoisomerase 3 [Muribaculaceae bacterium]
MILCITEKPSVGRDIARILGANTSHGGYYEGNGYWVTWTLGHLCELKEPAEYNPAWKHWGLGYLPMIPERFGIRLKHDRGVEMQFKVIEKLIRECDEIINCGDAGQEGELIQRWVMQKAGCNKPVKRLWVSSLTDEAVREGFRHLRPEQDLHSLYTAGLCRAIGDWLLGMNATRLYTGKYASNRQILSVGRVQTPTLALVVNRQLEIENFVPKDSWELRTLYRDVTFVSTLKPFDTEEKGSEVLERIKDSVLEIISVTKKSGKEAPPRLFDLTLLQVETNKKFGMSADETLRTIQSLYEKKLTTYPRVDTTYLTDDIYPKCDGILRSLKPYASLTAPLTASKLRKSKKVFDNSKVTDHHAIIPTGQSVPSSLSIEEKRVFHTIALRFISAFYPDCTFEQTTVEAKSADVKFKANGKVIKDAGWRVVYSKPGEGEKNDADDVMPAFTKGESGPHKPVLAKRTSQPPKYYTEGTLLKAMETAGSTVEDEDLREALKANGIGRPSTRAAIIETLKRRGYIVQERKSLRATQGGIELIGVIKEELLKSARLTGIWEGKLRQIERGTYSPQKFMEELKEMVREVVVSVMSDPENRRINTGINTVNGDKKSAKKKK